MDWDGGHSYCVLGLPRTDIRSVVRKQAHAGRAGDAGNVLVLVPFLPREPLVLGGSALGDGAGVGHCEGAVHHLLVDCVAAGRLG